MKKIYLRELKTITHSDYQSSANEARRVCFAVSGYESRSIAWFKAFQSAKDKSEAPVWRIIGFEEQKDVLHRPQNDKFYQSAGLTINTFPVGCGNSVMDFIRENVIENRDARPLHVHFDYSCMPRTWYCNLPATIEPLLRPGDRAYLWYSTGDYSMGNYPTAGTSDFHVFAGRPSLSPAIRSHVFGLGFDRVRSSAILSVLDPQYLASFYADPGVKPEYVAKVKEDNKEVLAQSNLILAVPIDDFHLAFSRITSIAMELRKLGDVVTVPDGPKPLVLAASLVPLFIGGTGIVALHVARRSNQTTEPRDVAGTGEFYGFSFTSPVRSDGGDQ